jgi:hypothetical protein
MRSIKEIMADARRTGRDPLDIIKSDPEWLTAQAERDRASAQLHRTLIEDARPLSAALAMLNYRIDTAWDLVNADYVYRTALPVLVEHLQRHYHPRNLEGIVRSLTVRPARDLAWDALMEIARRPASTPPEESLQDAAFNALSVIATTDDLPFLAQMAIDRTLASGRSAFLIRLRKAKYPQVEEILNLALDDPAVVTQARTELRKMHRQLAPKPK